MKSLLVKHIKSTSAITAKNLRSLLDENGIEWNPIDNVCWAEDYPYAPKVKFRIAHTGNFILINYRVVEKAVRAVAETDNGNVWEDSCCEFFFSPSADNMYYNIESNCAGKILFASGNTRHDRKRYPLDFVSKIDRWSSLGDGVFDERSISEPWEMCLAIPVSMFEGVGQLSGMTSHANFYKCGDKLSTPHFLSWNLVETEKPDYHRPDYFGEIIFE